MWVCITIVHQVSSRDCAIAIYIDQIAQVLNIAIIFLTLALRWSLVWMCLLMCLPYLLSLCVKHHFSRSLHRYTLTFRALDVPMLKSLFLPSVSFLSLPASNAIILQGFTLVVNKFFGADATVLFNTTRTMCNFAKQFLIQITFSINPEYSIAYGERNTPRIASLLRKSYWLSSASIVVIVVGILCLGPVVYEVWTRGAVAFSYPLMVSFLVILVAEGCWLPSQQLVVSTNHHQQMCWNFLASSVLALLVCYVLVRMGAGLAHITYSQLLIHAITGYASITVAYDIAKGKS
ncbi:MAG: hypothetical protein HUK02_07170 [Bacteroidaceae bacterium]|nr:hypothetical protein [Bacteroidaceae bacterium]